MDKYKQVLLKKNETSYRVFVPKEFAVIGKLLRVKEEDVWVDGWRVEEISSNEVDEDHLPDSHKAIKAHRNQTGDSAPKEKSKRES